MGQARQRQAEIAALKSRDISVKIKFNNQPVVIQPLLHITPEFWAKAQRLFIASYKPFDKRDGARTLLYDVAKWCNFALAYKGDEMVGFIKVLDVRAVENWYLSQPGVTMRNGEISIWHKDRPSNLNSRQIEICWVDPAHRGRGTATRLYQYALAHMGATHIHIDPHRVWDRIPYWRGLGFTKCILYANGDPEPSTRLHIPTADEHFRDLNRWNLNEIYDDRGLKIPLTREQRQDMGRTWAQTCLA